MKRFASILAVIAGLPLFAMFAVASDLGASVSFPARYSPQAVAPAGDIVFESGESDVPQGKWDTVLFQGTSSDDSVRFEVSRKLPSGGWAPWQRASSTRYDNGRFWAKARLGNGTGSLRLRAVAAGGSSTHAVDIFTVEVFSAGQKEAGSLNVRQSPGTGEENVAKPLVHGRQEWHARNPSEAYTPDSPYRITIHHSDGVYTTSLEESLKEARVIQDFHMDGRGWIDIAYHFLIDAQGNIIEGRPEGVVGAHTENQNTGNIGIVFLGNFHPPKNDVVTPEALAALKKLLRYLIARYHINPENLKGHRDYKGTDCPGDELYALIPGIRAELESSIASGKALPPPEKPLTLKLPPSFGVPKFD